MAKPNETTLKLSTHFKFHILYSIVSPLRIDPTRHAVTHEDTQHVDSGGMAQSRLRSRQDILHEHAVEYVLFQMRLHNTKTKGSGEGEWQRVTCTFTYIRYI